MDGDWARGVEKGTGILRRQLIYVQVHQDHFVACVVAGDKSIRRECNALGNRAGPVRNFSILQGHIEAMIWWRCSSRGRPTVHSNSSRFAARPHSCSVSVGSLLRADTLVIEARFMSSFRPVGT
jgi:hypothetical protein